MFDLKGFRKANKISQVELADFLGVGQGFISQMENGTRPIPDYITEKILRNTRWRVDGMIASSLGGENVSEEEDLRNECDALRNKITQLEHTIVLLSQQLSGQDFIEQNGGSGNIGKIACELKMKEAVALQKENELLCQQIEDLKAQNEKYWAMIEKLTAQ